MPEAVVGSAGESDSRRESCTRTAERILALAPATTALDVGCGSGQLVQAFVVKGVDAYGIDISDGDVVGAHPDVRDRLRVASVAEIESRFDLITCIDVLEHLNPALAQDAIDAMTSATDRIVFSSGSLAAPQWAAWFAERGFFRRAAADLSFLTPWAILFERGEPSPRELVSRYEGVLMPLLGATQNRREGTLDSQRDVSRLGEAGTDEEVHRRAEDAVRAAHHDLLISRDQVIGSEAEVGRVNRDLTRLAAELRTTTRKLRRTTERRDELQQKLGRSRRQSEQQVQSLRKRVAQLEGELAAARVSFPRRVARALRRRLR
ncbi:MAG: class I SAM-dependent methyltransferase [Nocardioides sp.]|nr:class I SAM-dependent methyltransferase [Nocardioides sp.]